MFGLLKGEEAFSECWDTKASSQNKNIQQTEAIGQITGDNTDIRRGLFHIGKFIFRYITFHLFIFLTTLKTYET